MRPGTEWPRPFAGDHFAGFSGISGSSLPVIGITRQAKERLDLYIQSLEQAEISGLAAVDANADAFSIPEIILLPQTSTRDGMNVDLVPIAISQYLTQAVIKGDDTSRLKVWWHSHANGGVFWSPKDTATIDRILKIGPDWLISIVGNTRGEYRVRLDFKAPVRFTLDELPLKEIPEMNGPLAAEIAREIAEKVTLVSPASQQPPAKRRGRGGRSGRAAPVVIEIEDQEISRFGEPSDQEE